MKVTGIKNIIKIHPGQTRFRSPERRKTIPGPNGIKCRDTFKSNNGNIYYIGPADSQSDKSPDAIYDKDGCIIHSPLSFQALKEELKEKG